MASKQTEQLKLNLWEPEDEVLREEFNENTAKIEAALTSKGNCYIVSGSYTGNGRYGANAPNTLSFPGKPLLVVVVNSGILCAVSAASFAYGFGDGGSICSFPLTWAENSFSWYHTYDAAHQLNTSGKTYHYIALYAA